MCNPDGTCPDALRDWCTRCNACTVYDGETCTGCGRKWGHD